MSEPIFLEDDKLDGWYAPSGTSAVVMSSPSSSSSGRSPNGAESLMDKEKGTKPKELRTKSRSFSKSPQRQSQSSTREPSQNSRHSQPQEKMRDKDTQKHRPSSSSEDEHRKKTNNDKTNEERHLVDRKRHCGSPERKNRSRRSRSRSPIRHRYRDHSPYRERRHSRERDCRKRSRSRDRRNRRSRSRSYERRHYRRRRTPSRDRYRRRRRSRSSSRSRSRTPQTNKDKSKSQAGTSSSKVGSLPLSTMGGAMTPQMALQQAMAAMSAKAQALTGIELPKYYNPAAVNPLKYAEQVQKRKLLWQTAEKDKEEQSKSSVWDKLKFAQDDDGKMTAKFRKLMGMKNEEAHPTTEEAEPPTETVNNTPALQQQEELFRNLDQQYEMARMSTHTHRGVGLGYSSQAPLFPPLQKP